MPVSQRKGDWITTFTGKRFWPLDPRPEEDCQVLQETYTSPLRGLLFSS